eukprot:66635-Pyramimonas_sp.AAC.1
MSSASSARQTTLSKFANQKEAVPIASTMRHNSSRAQGCPQLMVPLQVANPQTLPSPPNNKWEIISAATWRT